MIKKSPSVWDKNCPILEAFGIHWLHDRGNKICLDCPLVKSDLPCVLDTNKLIQSNLGNKVATKVATLVGRPEKVVRNLAVFGFWLKHPEVSHRVLGELMGVSRRVITKIINRELRRS